MNITEIETALQKIAADNDLTYVSLGLSILPTRKLYGCSGHRGKLAKAGHGPTLEAAIAAMIADDFIDTAPLSAERARIEAAGRAVLDGRAAA